VSLINPPFTAFIKRLYPMKLTRSTPTFRHCLALCALSALLATSLAQSPPPTPVPSPAPPATPAPAQPEVREVPAFKSGPQVRMDLLMVSVPQAKALALLPDLRDPQKLPAAQAKLLEMIEHQEATLIDWPELTAFTNQRGVTENIVELRYPIEFELPKVPDKSPEPATAPVPPSAKPAAEPPPARARGQARWPSRQCQRRGFRHGHADQL
jgi:hypothetical protein